MAMETAVTLSLGVLAAMITVLTALTAGAVATSVATTAIGIGRSIIWDNGPLDTLAFRSVDIFLLLLLQTGSLVAITEPILHVNLMMIQATL